MTVRFADILSTKKDAQLASGRQDFVVRTRRPVWQTICMLFAAVFLVSIALAYFIEDTIFFSQVIFLLLAATGTYVVIIIQRSRDLVLATEFQNALLSSALSYSNKFCLIINNDSSIAYIDHSFQEMFPDFYKEPRRAVDVLLERGQVSKDDRKTIFSAIERRIHGKVVFDITDSKSQEHRIMMSVEPIIRPKGFMLLRGREFVEKRIVAPQLANDSKTPIFNKKNMELFSYVTDSLDVGAYMIDLFGNITYANLTLEQWLDFDEGELTSREFSLKNIVSQTGLDGFVEDIKNFNGEVLMARKVGGHVKAFIKQDAMYDEQGVVIGYAALIHQIKEEKVNKKKNKHFIDKW